MEEETYKAFAKETTQDAFARPLMENIVGYITLLRLNPRTIFIQCSYLAFGLMHVFHNEPKYFYRSLLPHTMATGNRLVLKRRIPMRARKIYLAKVLHVESLSSRLDLHHQDFGF